MPNRPTDKFFDVTHPGKRPAEAASRPVIVGNRPLMEDPMMKTNDQPAIREHKHGEITPTGNDLTDETASLPVQQMSVSTPDSGLEEEEVEKLTEQQTYFVHITGAKGRKVLLRFVLLVVGLVAMAAVGYYAVSFLQK